VVLTINPEYPKAGESVTASVSTFTADLDNAQISWILNGETMLTGVGKKNFSFTVGNSGFQTTLEVQIETLTGSLVNKKIVIAPSDIDMLWQAYNTYTPPFYKGKTLASNEGQIKVVAIPSIQNLAGYSYTWRQDDKSKQDSSGYGKNSYVYQNSFLDDSNTVEVAVSDILGNSIGSGTISINPGSPKIIFYKKDQILGTNWGNSITDGYTLNKDGDTIVAEPYFFSLGDLNSSGYDFNWFLNGEQTTTPSPPNTLSIKPEGSSGTATIKVIINNTKTLFQSMTKEINVNF
jgi:hypothetical protein